MQRLVFVFIFIPTTVFAKMPLWSFQSVSCGLSVDGDLKNEVTSALIPLTVDDHMGRFVELQLGDEKQKIQYQILIEDDVSVVAGDQLIVLQNLMVDGQESSSEFTTKDLNWCRISQGRLSVSCKIN